MNYNEFVDLIGLRIKEIRLKKFPNETYNAIAHRAKMRGTDWEAIEKGKSNPTLKTISKIADALDCDLSLFFPCKQSDTEPKISLVKHGK